MMKFGMVSGASQKNFKNMLPNAAAFAGIIFVPAEQGREAP